MATKRLTRAEKIARRVHRHYERQRIWLEAHPEEELRQHQSYSMRTMQQTIKQRITRGGWRDNEPEVQLWWRPAAELFMKTFNFEYDESKQWEDGGTAFVVPFDGVARPHINIVPEVWYAKHERFGNMPRWNCVLVEYWYEPLRDWVLMLGPYQIEYQTDIAYPEEDIRGWDMWRRIRDEAMFRGLKWAEDGFPTSLEGEWARGSQDDFWSLPRPILKTREISSTKPPILLADGY